MILCFLCSELFFRDSCELQYFCKPELNSQDKSGFWIWVASRSSASMKYSFSKLVFCHLGTAEGGTGTDSTSQRAVPFCLNHEPSLWFLQFPALLYYYFNFHNTVNKPLSSSSFVSYIFLIHRQNKLFPVCWVTSLTFLSFLFNLRHFLLCA